MRSLFLRVWSAVCCPSVLALLPTGNEAFCGKQLQNVCVCAACRVLPLGPFRALVLRLLHAAVTVSSIFGALLSMLLLTLSNLYLLPAGNLVPPCTVCRVLPFGARIAAYTG